MRLGLLFGLFLLACSSTTTTPAKEEDKDEEADTEPEPTPRPDVADEEPETPAPTTAKIHDAPVLDFAATDDALFLTNGTDVEKTAADGRASTKLGELAGAVSLAVSGTKLFASIKGTGASSTFVTTRLDGTGKDEVGSWDGEDDGPPSALVVNGARAYFFTTETAGFWSLDLATSNLRFEDTIDGRIVRPVFAGDRLFLFDYAIPSLYARKLDGSFRRDIVVDDPETSPTLGGGVATDGTDVFARTSQGIVKVPVTTSNTTTPTVIVPVANCGVKDPASSEDVQVEDALALGGTTLYVACRVEANVEVRAYDTDGKLLKTVATQPFQAGLTHLRVNATAVYWLANSGTVSAPENELWRAPR